MAILEQLRATLQERGLDALWVSQPVHVRLVSGFTSPEDGKVLVTADNATLYTDARYTVQAQEEARIPQHIARPPTTYQHAAESLSGKKVGFEADHLTVAGLEELKQHWPTAELIPTQNLMYDLRLVKTEDEVSAIRRAQDLADRVFAEVRPLIQPGVRELDIALEIEQRLRRAGATPAFDIIVASGPRGAMPHGTASERVIGDNELVTVDMGAQLGGYHSDMTRTVAVGNPSEELRQLYRAVLESEEAAVQAVRPGVKTHDLDVISRDVLAGHNLAQYFSHSLGHGVGMAVHEGPSLRQNSEDVLQPGMIITIEPGVYLPDVGGVRIEDLLLVTEDGYEVLSHAPKETL